MSIPGMSAGMPAVLAGVGEVSDPTATGIAAALIGVAADDSWCEGSVNDPNTAIAATAVPTDTTRIRRRHPGAPYAGRRKLVSLTRSPMLLIVMSVQPSRCHDTGLGRVYSPSLSHDFRLHTPCFPR